MNETPAMRWLRRLLGFGEFPGGVQVHPAARLTDALEVGMHEHAPGLLPALPDLPLAVATSWPRNHQVGAQPERAAAVQAGHSVTGPYLLTGGLPLPAAVPERLTANLELLFTPHPLQVAPGNLNLGPMGPPLQVRPQ